MSTRVRRFIHALNRLVIIAVLLAGIAYLYVQYIAPEYKHFMEDNSHVKKVIRY